MESNQNPQRVNPMNDPEPKSPLPSGDLAMQVAALQRQVSVLLLVLLVVSMTLAAYLRYEDYIYHKDAAAIKPQAMQIINTFNAATAGMNRQAVLNFINQLVVYGQKNPDYAQQVLKKYGFAPPPPKPAPTTTSIAPKPAPVAPAAPAAPVKK